MAGVTGVTGQSSTPGEDSSLDDTLASLMRTLKVKKERLEQREKALEKRCEALNEKHADLFGDKSDSDVLTLNVGGDMISVLRRTLCSVEGSMLAARFSGRWDDSLEKDGEGNFFICQPIELFKPMINFLRARAISTPLAPPVRSPNLPAGDREDFYRMVEYFGMTSGIYPTVIELHRGDQRSVSIEGKCVDCSEWSTFTLQTQGHVRQVISYEIVLGNVERMQIGWINEKKYIENLSNEPHNGVGEEANSVGIDCCRGGLLLEGSFTKLEGLSIKAGSTILCDQKGHRWYVNGELVCSSNAADGTKQFEHSSGFPPAFNCVTTDIVPCFSGKGIWTVTEVVLSCP